MTCASCVRRVEKALGKVEGVQEASVNLATERATVVFDPVVASVDVMRAAVAKAGYELGDQRPPEVAQAEGTVGSTATIASESVGASADAHDLDREREVDDLKRKWTLSLGAGLVMMALMYLPLNITMDVLAPVLLIVATLVQFWAGAPIYKAAWTAARHGSTNMHTLVAVGTSAAYGYSAFVTPWPRLAK